MSRILDSKPKLLPSSYLSTYIAQYEDNDNFLYYLQEIFQLVLINDI